MKAEGRDVDIRGQSCLLVYVVLFAYLWLSAKVYSAISSPKPPVQLTLQLEDTVDDSNPVDENLEEILDTVRSLTNPWTTTEQQVDPLKGILCSWRA